MRKMYRPAHPPTKYGGCADRKLKTQNQIIMNHIVLKWVKLWSPLFILLVMAGCVKPNKATFTDFSQVSDHVVLRNSGLANFKASNIRFAGDTMTYDVIVDLASVG